MRILFITLDEVSRHKGSSTHIREKVAALRQRGHHVLLLGGSHEPFDFGDFKSIGSFRKPDGSTGYLALLAVFLRLIVHIVKSSKGIDVIQVREPLAAFAAVITKPIHRRKIIFEVNSLDNEELRMKGNTFGIRVASRTIDFLQRIDAKCSDRIMVITERVKDYYQSKYKIPENRLRVLGVTADPNKFHPIENSALLGEYRHRLKISEEACIVLFLGNMAHWQDFGLFVRSAKAVLEKNPMVRFVLAGDGSQRDYLENAIRREGLVEGALVIGSVPHSEVVFYINMSDICISLCKELASGYSPMKLYEYFACGKPVVATRVVGYEAVEEIHAGRLVDADDTEGFASAILSLADNRELRREYGNNALLFAREHLGWDKIIAEIESVIEEIVPHDKK